MKRGPPPPSTGSPSKRQRPLEQGFEVTAEALKEYILRKIIKENHGGEIVGIAFNTTQADAHNMVATVGANQLNVYDNEHVGDHLDIVSQYISPEPIGSLLCVAWGDHPTDSLLILGSSSGALQIVSLVRSIVVGQDLHTHSGPITSISVPPPASGLAGSCFLAQCASDGTSTLHALPDGTVLATCHDNASAIAWPTVATIPASSSSSSSTVGTHTLQYLAGATDGSVSRWEIPFILPSPTREAVVLEGRKISTFGDAENVEEAEAPGPSEPPEPTPSLVMKLGAQQKGHAGSPIDCMAVLGTGKVVTKSLNGVLLVWEMTGDSAKVIHRMRVSPPTLDGGQNSTFTHFALSPCGSALAIGVAKTIRVISTSTWETLGILQHTRARTIVYSVAFNATGKQVLASGSDAFLWRYDYFPPETDAQKAAREAREARKASIKFRPSSSTSTTTTSTSASTAAAP